MKYTKESFIFDGELCLALVDKRITCDMELELKRRNIEIIKTIGCDETYDAIKYHPDIFICNLGNGDIVVAPNVYDYYNDVLTNKGFNVIKGESHIGMKYPYNISYNIAIFGNYALHNFKYTESNILNYVNEKKLIKINLNQGYSKCSICIVDESSIITSDIGIYNAVKAHNIDCLLIEKGHIELFNLDYGFIGGCTGLIGKNKLAFLGDVTKHPDYSKIEAFLKLKNKEVVCLSEEKLLDLGSIIPLMARKER